MASSPVEEASPAQTTVEVVQEGSLDRRLRSPVSHGTGAMENRLERPTVIGHRPKSQRVDEILFLEKPSRRQETVPLIAEKSKAKPATLVSINSRR